MENQISFVGRKSHFSKNQKEQILKRHRVEGISISQLARENGINAITVYNWKRKMNQEEDEAITPEKIKQLIAEITSLKGENKQLKVKVADLAVTNDILTDAIDIAKKRALLKQVQLLENSKTRRNTK